MVGVPEKFITSFISLDKKVNKRSRTITFPKMGLVWEIK